MLPIFPFLRELPLRRGTAVFGMGMTEILLVLALALIVIGPKKPPHVARMLGRGLAELRRASEDLQRSVYQETHRPLNPKEFLRSENTADVQVKPGPPPGEKPRAAADPSGEPDENPGEAPKA